VVAGRVGHAGAVRRRPHPRQRGDFAKAGYQDATVGNYRRTVLTAMQEVEDGITGLSALDSAWRRRSRPCTARAACSTWPTEPL
jgi:hypothetical protein